MRAMRCGPAGSHFIARRGRASKSPSGHSTLGRRGRRRPNDASSRARLAQSRGDASSRKRRRARLVAERTNGASSSGSRRREVHHHPAATSVSRPWISPLVRVGRWRELRIVDPTGTNAILSRPERGKTVGALRSYLRLTLPRLGWDRKLLDLDKLMRLTRDHGGGFVSTLPFLAAFPNEPSPYSPSSRLFWNELFIDTGNSAKSPPRTPLDYHALDASHRRALVRMERNTDALEAFQRRFPLVLDYARFRAATTLNGAPWNRWPEPHRSGLLEEKDVDADEVLYHLYNQLIAEEQIAALSNRGIDLHLDLPLGVHRHGYDTWREQTLFAADVAVGAPPDAAFPGGQNWSSPPVLPHKSRQQGHRYLRLAFRHAMRKQISPGAPSSRKLNVTCGSRSVTRCGTVYAVSTSCSSHRTLPFPRTRSQA